jgi:DNA polymerase III subunit beta
VPDNTFHIQAGALRQAVAIAGCVAGKLKKIPVLEHLHLSAPDGRLTLQGSNLEAWASASAAGEGRLQPLTASARHLAALLRHVADEEMVALHHPAPERPLEITAGALRARIFTLPAEDFPEWGALTPEAPGLARWSIPAGTLRQLIGQCLHAVSKEETRYYLNGVFIHPQGEGEAAQLHAAATDGHRLMVATAALPAGQAPIPAIWPHHTLRRLHGLLSRVPGDAAVEVAQTHLKIEVTTPAWSLRFKTIDGTFPNYQAVIPKEGAGVPIQVQDPRGLARAIHAITAVGTERSRPVKLSNGTGNTLRISHREHEGGEAEMALPETIAAWASNKPHPEAGFQSRYLLDICRVFPAGFTMRVSTQSQPCRIEAAEGLGVLMPMWV